MAWWSRVPIVRGIVERVNRVNRTLRPPAREEQPYQPPPYQPRPQRVQRAQPIWSSVQPTVSQPADTGDWITSDEGDYTPVYDDSSLYGGEPNETVTLYDQNIMPIEYEQDTGAPVSFTGPEWFAETFHSKEYLISKYGIDNIDILQALKQGGYITDEDWQAWREIYGGQFY